MGKQKIQKIIWRELNRKTSVRGLPWYVPKIPSILQMLIRSFALAVLNLGVWAIELILILGEDVFWKFNFVDNIYTRLGTNTFDTMTFTVVITWFLIWGVGGIVWILGYWDRWT